jgi:DNA topoisomerase-1
MAGGEQCRRNWVEAASFFTIASRCSHVSVTITQLDPEHAAKEARLRYVSDRMDGYHRRRCGKGFSYHDASGRLIRDPALRRWIRALVIPPAWEEVWISPYRNGHILATGRDEKGRKQYIYHPRWTALRAERNFHQLLRFGSALPALRQRIDADLRQRGLQRQRVLALVVHLLDETLIRVGNSEYAERNRSYGLTTLRSRHLELEGARIHFEFRGKSGKQHSVDIRDRRVARIIRQCQELPGQELFQYLDEEGQSRAVDSADVNDYLAAATGEPFTAKMFRTWGGSVTMVQALLELPPPQSQAEVERNVRAAIKAASQRLANTVAVCRRHYVHPLIAATYEAGDFLALCQSGGGQEPALDEAEQALMRLLQAQSQAA